MMIMRSEETIEGKKHQRRHCYIFNPLHYRKRNQELFKSKVILQKLSEPRFMDKDLQKSAV